VSRGKGTAQLADLAKAGLTGIAISLVNYLAELPYFCDEVIGRLERIGLREKVRLAASA
jgi:FMNH2-dependent dimethyl sulfone monooxygenase